MELLNPSVKSRIGKLAERPPHACLISGISAADNYNLAVDFANTVLKNKDFGRYPYKLVIESKNGKAIGVDEISSLQRFLALKVSGENSINRIAIIKDADLMSLPAQNALLKTLEEPPIKTILILTSSNV